MGEVWEGWFTVCVVFVAFGCLLWDVVAPDHVMMGALAVLMVSNVVSVAEGLSGFANEGLLTVAVLFVVAAGISATGGLDWYMGKLLGRPRTIAGAQLRLMVPIAVVSAFLNNTPVVAVMIPIVQRWAENIRLPKEQVMMPLSFASILGGTCTLIGTSTNLVVLGMLNEWKGADGTSTRTYKMGLFDLGLYGVPVALSGMCYVLLASRRLLPGGAAARRSGGGAGGAGGGAGGKGGAAGGRGEDLIVGARLQAWSAAVGRTVAGSGLRGLPGLYLVSVKRDETLMRAVGPEFVLAQGDVLYFTGLVESLGRVCAEYGLMAMTSEHDSDDDDDDDDEVEVEDGGGDDTDGDEDEIAPTTSSSPETATAPGAPSDRGVDRGGGRGVPAAVPEKSELLEMQMLARSQSIWGKKGGGGGAKTKSTRGGGRGRTRGGGGAGGSTASGTSAGETTSGGEGDDKPIPRDERWRRASATLSGGVSPGVGRYTDGDDDAEELDGEFTARRSIDRAERRRRGSLDASRGGAGAHHHHHARDYASFAVDRGERRALKIYRADAEKTESERRRDLERELRKREAASSAAEKALGPPKVTVEADPEADPNDASHAGRMVLGISATDRPGLLHDISQALNRLRVQLLHCEASAVANRSVSIWRLQTVLEETTREEIALVIDALLAPETGVEAVKKKGSIVLRVRVRESSRLVGSTPAEVNFRSAYNAAIVAMQRGGRSPEGKLGTTRLAAGDALVLQVREDSPLLEPAPKDLSTTGEYDSGGEDVAPAAASGGGGAGGRLSSPFKRVGSSSAKLSSGGGGGTPAGSANDLVAKGETPADSARANPNGALAGMSFQSRRRNPGENYYAPQTTSGISNSNSAATATPTPTPTPPGAGSGAKPSTAGMSIRSRPADAASADDVALEIPDGVPAARDPATLRARRVRVAHRDLEVIADSGGGGGDGNEFLIAVRVKPGAKNFIGKTADGAGLRSLPGLFLVSIERKREDGDAPKGEAATAATVEPPAQSSSSSSSSAAKTLSPPLTPPSLPPASGPGSVDRVDVVDPTDDALRADDVLWYAGNAKNIAMIRKVPGLAPYSSDQVSKMNANEQERRLIQAVVAKTGPLVGKSIRDIKFRTRYNAVVLAVHREGVRVHARIGDVVLHPGDVLLLDAGPDFHREASHGGSGFALVSVLEDSAPPRLRLLVPVLFIAVAMIIAYTAGLTELIVAALFAAGIMMCVGALSEQEARDAIKWDVIVTIAAAFGISKALQNSGVASAVANKLVDAATASGTGYVGLLVAVYLATFLISNVVTNNAAAALMFPIAAEAAEMQGESLLKIAFCVMLAASASFMSPFGYQTNLMVYGPGGYVFADFLRFGSPMQVAQLIVSVTVLALGEEWWWTCWLTLSGSFAFVCAVMTRERNYCGEGVDAVARFARGAVAKLKKRRDGGGEGEGEDGWENEEEEGEPPPPTAEANDATR